MSVLQCVQKHIVVQLYSHYHDMTNSYCRGELSRYIMDDMIRTALVCVSVCVNPHWQLVIEAFQADHQSVFSSYQFVLQLSHVGLVGRFCQVMSQDVHKQVEQNQTETMQKTQQQSVCNKKINSSSFTNQNIVCPVSPCSYCTFVHGSV